MLDTNTVNFAMDKISEGFQKALPHVENVSEVYVKYCVTNTDGKTASTEAELSFIKNTTEEKSKKKSKRREITKTSQEGLPVNWTRATFIVREDLLETIKDIAYWDRKKIKPLINEILESYINKREKKTEKPNLDNSRSFINA